MKSVSNNRDHIKILIVDDEAIVGKRLKRSLSEEHISVDTCVDPSLAMEKVIENNYDVIVTDLRMGNIDGIELLSYIRKYSKQSKVILITAFATIEVAREAIVKGAVEILAKPFKPSELKNKIYKIIK